MQSKASRFCTNGLSWCGPDTLLLTTTREVATSQFEPFMPRQLPERKHKHIEALYLRGEKPCWIARKVDCNIRSVRRIISNTRRFGATHPPPNKTGRRSNITPIILRALCDELEKRPCLYREEMILFLHEEFGIDVSLSSMTRALQRVKWSNKVARRVAKQRNPKLRHLYNHKLAEFSSYHLIYIDESGSIL